MIYYYTALVLTYAIEGTPVTTKVWYDRERHCREAVRSGLMDGMYDQLYDLYGNDMMLTCEVSDVPSFILKPKLRPKEQNNG